MQIFAFKTFAQTGEVTRQFVNYEGKPTKNKYSLHYIETYKTSNTDTYWTIKMYYADTTEGTIAFVGKCRDVEGQIKEGPFVYYYKNGSKKSEGDFANNLKEGEWKEWNESGNLSAVNHFKKGKMVGRNISWFTNKALRDSTLLDENGNGKSFRFYEDGAKQGEGNYASGDKNGVWVYYYSNVKNQKSMEVIYEMDSAKNYTCFTEAGEIQKKGCFFEREAKFRGGEEGWNKYLVKKLTAKSDIYEKLLKPNEVYTIIVRFAVSKDGSIKDVFTEKKRNAQLDAMAIEIIQDSPVWEPAVQHNRKIIAYRRQPISFVGYD